MKFGENLQKLRKEKGISQEQLAEQLGVTRQSVSKWESGNSYPEMDKLVTICQIFDCDLDSLINKDIMQENSKQEATSIVKIMISEVTTYIKKTIQLLEQNSLKEIIKIIAQVLIIIFVICLFRIPFSLIEDTISNIFYGSNNIISNFFIRFWHFLFAAGYAFLAIAAFLYIFKIKFLDKEELEDSVAQVEESKEETAKELAKEEPVIKEKTTASKQGTKVRGLSLLDLLVKIITIGIKGTLLLLLLPIIFGTISTIIGLVLGIILIFKGLFLAGPMLFLLALVIFGIVIMELILNFVFNLKFSKRRIIITIITSIALGSIGIALSIWFCLNLNIINHVPNTMKLTEIEQTHPMTESMFMHTYNDTTYIEDETLMNNIKVKISYYEGFYNVDIVNKDNEIKLIYKDREHINSKKIVDNFIDNLKKKKVYTYNQLMEAKITITASKENIKKLQENNERAYNTELDEFDDQDNYNS